MSDDPQSGLDPPPAASPVGMTEGPRRSSRLLSSKTAPLPGAAPLGLALFLASLAVLFTASLVGYAAVRLRAEQWPPPGMPALPPGLWVSTTLLLISSVTMHAALRGVRRGDARALRVGLVATTALGVLFLVSQVVSWWALVSLRVTAGANLYAFTFYLLTALHGAHLLAGLVPLGVTTRRAFAGRYGQGDHQGVVLIAMYWHFLDGVWLVLFSVLYLIG